MASATFAADVPISALPAATTVSGADVAPIVQGGTTKKASMTVLSNFLTGVPTTRTLTIGGTSLTLAADRSWTTNTILEGLGSPVQGDIMYRGASNWVLLTPGTDGNILTTHGAAANPTWSPPPATGAPSDAHYLTSQAESGLSNEVNLGALSTGLVKITVSGSIATPSVVVPGTGIETFIATPSSANLKTAVTDETGSGGALVFATGPTLSAPVLGTPASGTLTNCTGLPVASIVGDTSTALGVGTIELGHATATTLSGSSGVLSVEGVVIPSVSSTNTLTNKRVTKRSTSVSNTTTWSINTDNFDYGDDSGLTGSVTIDTTGTPTVGQTLWVSITGTAARGITWDASDFEASTVALPTTTVSTNRLDVGFIWNPATTKWRCVAAQ